VFGMQHVIADMGFRRKRFFTMVLPPLSGFVTSPCVGIFRNDDTVRAV